jgi:hypothetical protein
MNWLAFNLADGFPCKTAIYVLKFLKINLDNECIENKSIFHFFQILANKISKIFVFRVTCNGATPVFPACSAIPQRIWH